MKKIILQNLRVGLFLFSVQFVVAIIFLFWIFHIATLIDVIILSAITTLAFMICMALYQFFYIKGHKISLNDFSIQAKQEVTFTVDKTFGETKNTIENIIPGKI